MTATDTNARHICLALGLAHERVVGPAAIWHGARYGLGRRTRRLQMPRLRCRQARL